MTVEASGEHDLPDPSPLVGIAFLAPWAAVSAFLPDPWRMASLGLVALLAVLLLAAGAWSFRAALERGLDPGRWAFATILTLGVAMFVLLARAEPIASSEGSYVCLECGREAPLLEAFCYACGAV